MVVTGNISVDLLIILVLPLVQLVKDLPAMQEIQIQSLGRGDPLEKEMATCSSILAWRIPSTKEPGGLQPTGSQRVGHDLATKKKKKRTKQEVLHHTELDWLFWSHEVKIILTVYHRSERLERAKTWIQDLNTKSLSISISITTTWAFGKKQRKQVWGHLS